MAARVGLFTAFFLEAGLPQTPESAHYGDAATPDLTHAWGINAQENSLD